jgi:hypothetical protein
MRDRLGRVVDKRAAGKHNPKLLPPRTGNKGRYGDLGTRYVEQTGEAEN